MEGEGRISHLFRVLGGRGKAAGRRHSTSSKEESGHTSITWFVLRLRTSTQFYGGLYNSSQFTVNSEQITNREFTLYNVTNVTTNERITSTQIHRQFTIVVVTHSYSKTVKIQ